MSMILPPWVRWLALVAVALALYGIGRIDGARIEGARHLDYLAKQAAATVKVARAQERVVVRTEVEYRERIRIIREKGDVVIKEVPVYITAETDQRFPVPGGFVRVHDAAATGAPAGPARDSDGEAAAITSSAAAETIAINYAACRRYSEQVTGWQEFYQRLQDATNTTADAP